MDSKVVDLLNNIFNINLRGYSLMVYGMTGTEWREWDSYTSDEIKDYSVRGIHSALSDDEVEILFNFWSEFYENIRTNSAYVAMVPYAKSKKNEIEKIRNIRKELGKTTTEVNTNYVGHTSAINTTQVSTETPPNIPPSNNVSATYTKTIKEALDIMAEWYVNHVYTYQGKKQYDDFELADYNIGINNLNMYALGTGNELTIEFIKDGKGKTTIKGGNFRFTDTKEGADASIKKKGDNKTYYFQRKSNDLNNFKFEWLCYIKASRNACINNYPYEKSEKTGKLNYYIKCPELNKNVGDDCTRFAFAVLEKGTGIKAQELGDFGDDASQFIDNADTISNMSQYFDIYTGDAFIEEYKKGLHNGDMLVAKLGEGLEGTNQKNTRNHCEFIYNSSLNPTGVFGWGSVKKKTDSRARFSIKKNNTSNIEYIFNSEDGTYYSALYRKKDK